MKNPQVPGTEHKNIFTKHTSSVKAVEGGVPFYLYAFNYIEDEDIIEKYTNEMKILNSIKISYLKALMKVQ